MPDDTLTLLVAPSGDDANDGRTVDTPILSLSRAHELVAENCRDNHRNVEIRIGPGEYLGQETRWRFTMPDHTIRIMPLFNDKVRPRFIGNGGTWLFLIHSAGQRTNMHVEYMSVQNYQTAISLNGDRSSQATFNSHNRIYGCYFKDIGNVFDESLGTSTACVRLVNSRHNLIRNNHFFNVINTTEASKLHAIYVAHYSHHNRIESNRFVKVCGDPIKIRDYSNFNSIVDENRFDHTGITAAYTESYCNSDRRCHGIRANCECTKFQDLGITECPSWGNEFRNNRIGKAFNGLPLKTWHLSEPEEHSGCEHPSDPGIRRLRTSGNTPFEE